MFELPPVKEGDASEFARAFEDGRPIVLRGLVSDWPAVRAARNSSQDLCSYLSRLDIGTPLEAFVAPAHGRGRIFYDETMQGFNFQKAHVGLRELLEYLLTSSETDSHPGIYVGSTPTRQVVPGFERENVLRIAPFADVEPRLWIGNETNIAAHFDESDNVACVAAGRRRFVLFPPEQIRNLYVGPIDWTVAGPPSSLVDMRAPDLELFPKMREALSSAAAAELEPGDAIYIPSLWWHHVEALDPFNLLVNYWWQNSPADAGSPFPAIAHGLLTIAHLPAQQRRAWRSFFDHFVFQLDGDPAAHIPVHARGVLGESTPALRRRIKDFLLRMIGS